MDLLDIYDESDDEDDVAIERQRSSEYGQVRVVHQHEKRGNFPRSVPHTAGSWAGHIFLRLSSLEVTNESVGGWKQWLSKANWSGDIVLHDDFHVSLSRPFYLQEAFISSFVSHLETSVKEVPVFSLIVEKQQRVLENDDKTRSFLVQSIQFSASLMKLIHLVDDVMRRFGQSLYYDPPTFHVSIASIPAGIPDDSPPFLYSSKEESVHRIEALYCKFGTVKSIQIPLCNL